MHAAKEGELTQARASENSKEFNCQRGGNLEPGTTRLDVCHGHIISNTNTSSQFYKKLDEIYLQMMLYMHIKP